MSKDELVGLYLRGYIDRFKVRGARALGRIGGDEAKAALEQALADPNNSESVKRVIREALIDIKAPTADQFFGRWANEDPKTGGWTRIEIRADDADLYVQLWGSCQPTDCNAGEWPVPICDSDDRALRLQIDHGHAIRKMDLTLLSDHRMSVRTQTRFVDNSGRPDQDTTDTFVKR
jgi:hypothetical protein